MWFTLQGCPVSMLSRCMDAMRGPVAPSDHWRSGSSAFWALQFKCLNFGKQFQLCRPIRNSALAHGMSMNLMNTFLDTNRVQIIKPPVSKMINFSANIRFLSHLLFFHPDKSSDQVKNVNFVFWTGVGWRGRRGRVNTCKLRGRFWLNTSKTQTNKDQQFLLLISN